MWVIQIFSTVIYSGTELEQLGVSPYHKGILKI